MSTAAHFGARGAANNGDEEQRKRVPCCHVSLLDHDETRGSRFTKKG